MNKKDRMLNKLGFSRERERVRQNKCPLCDKPIRMEDFKGDELSIEEYRISGLCVECQNRVFKEDVVEGMKI